MAKKKEEKEVKQWITVRGKHVPIYEDDNFGNAGESSPNGEMKHIKLYHGSFQDFDEFDYKKGKEAKGGGSDQYGEGFYFTSDPQQARMFGNIIYEVDVAYSTDFRTAKKTGREKDFSYNPKTGYWVIPPNKAKNLKILKKKKGVD